MQCAANNIMHKSVVARSIINYIAWLDCLLCKNFFNAHLTRNSRGEREQSVSLISKGQILTHSL